MAVSQPTGLPDIAAGLPREIAPGVHWLGACLRSDLTGEVIHLHLSNYLVIGETETVLIDTGVPSSWKAVRGQIEQVLDGRQLDWVFPTHSEYPHSGSLANVLNDFPSARVTGDVRDYHLFYPTFIDRLVPQAVGDTLELGGGYGLTFVDAVLRDLPTSLWAYEAKTRVMFVADGFGYAHHAPGDADDDEPTHLPGECSMTVEELGDAISIDNAVFILRTALYWSRFVEPVTIMRRLAAMFDEYPSRVLAPAHGNVVTDVSRMLEVVHKVQQRASSL